MSITLKHSLHAVLLSALLINPALADPETTATSPAQLATPQQPAVLATAAGETPGVRAELLALKRTGGETLTLTFALINDSDKPLVIGYGFVEKGKNAPDFASIGGTSIIDAAGKKRYLVLRDSDDIPLCSRGIADISPKSSAQLWAKFPAPAAEVKTVTVLIPHFVPLDDVAITP